MNLRNQIAQDVIAQASWLKPFWLKRRILFQFNIFLLIPLSFSMRPGVCFEEPSQRDSIPGTKSYSSWHQSSGSIRSNESNESWTGRQDLIPDISVSDFERSLEVGRCGSAVQRRLEDLCECALRTICT